MKSIKLLALVAVLVPMLFACGKSDKQSNDGEKASSDKVEVASTHAELDVERIMTFQSKKGSELTEKDYDFLLDQLEIVVNKANELPAEQAKSFITTLDGEQQNAVMIVAMILADQSKFTDKQKQRFQELEARDPSKK